MADAVSIPDFTAQLAELVRNSELTTEELAAELATLWGSTENIVLLFQQMQSVIAIRSDILSAFQAALGLKGVVASVSALPAVAADRDAYKIDNALDAKDGHLYVRVAGAWTDLGRLTGSTGRSAYEVAAANGYEGTEEDYAQDPIDKAVLAATAADEADAVREATDLVRVATLLVKGQTEEARDAANAVVGASADVLAAAVTTESNRIAAEAAAGGATAALERSNVALADGYAGIAEILPTAYYYSGATWQDWVAVAVVGEQGLAAGELIEAAVVALRVAAGAETVRLKLWSRAVSSPNFTAGPGAAGDVLLETVTLTLAQLGLTAGATSHVEARFPLTSRAAVAGQAYLLEFRALDASAASVTFGIGRNDGISPVAPRSGFLKTLGAVGWTVPSGTIAWRLESRQLMSVAGRVHDLEAGVTALGGVSALVNTIDAALVAGLDAGADIHHLAGVDGLDGYGLGNNFGPFVSTFDGGTDYPAGARLDRIVQNLNVGVTATKVRMKLWTRPKGSSAANADPATATDLTLRETVTLLLASAALDPASPLVANNSNRVAVAFPLVTPLKIDASLIYIMEYAALDASDALTTIATARGVIEAGATQRHRGWFKTTPSSSGYTPVGTSSQTIYWRGDGRIYFDTTANAERLASVEADVSELVPLSGEVGDLKERLLSDYAAGFDTHHLAGADGSGGYGLGNNFGPFVSTFDGGTDYPAGARLDRIVQNLNVGATATKVRMKLWTRPKASSAANNDPNNTTGLVLLETVTLALASAALDPANPLVANNSNKVAVSFPLASPLTIDADLIYIQEYAALDASDALTTIAVAYGLVEAGATQRHRGWFKTTPSSPSYTPIGTTSNSIWWRGDGRLYFDPDANAARIAAAEADLAELEPLPATVAELKGALVTTSVVGQIASNNGFVTASFTSWMWGADVGTEIGLTTGQRIYQLTLDLLSITATVGKIRLAIYKRLLTSTDIDNPPPATGDVLLGTYDYAIADIGLTAGGSGQSCTLQFPEITDNLTGYTLIVRVSALNAAGSYASGVNLGVGRMTGISDGAVSQHKRGWYSTATGASPGWANISGSRLGFTFRAARIQGMSDVNEAAGSRSVLKDRLNQSLDPYGSPRRSFGAHSLRQYHYRRQKRVRPVAEATQNVIGLFGTSWTQNPDRWSGGFAKALYAEQGQAGVGWVGFGWSSAATGTWVEGGSQPGSLNGNVLRSDYLPAFIGTWTSPTYGDHPTPDTAIAQSATVNDTVKLAIPASPVASAVVLFWEATADGVVEYRFSGGSWTSLNVQGTVGDCYWTTLAGLPAGASTMEIRVSAGTVKLGGLNVKSAASGAVVHKLAVGGKGAAQLAPQAAKTSWRNGIAQLGLTTAVVLHGTNDQGSSSASWKLNMGSIATSIRAAVPACDVMLSVEAENARTTNTRTMAAMALDVAEIAAMNDYAFYDLQLDFGLATNPTFYQDAANGGTLPLFNASDLFHPEPVTGGRLIEAAMLRFFNSSMS